MIMNKDNKFLISKRKKQNLYGFPGGHLERYESFAEAACKETLEETGLVFKESDIIFLGMMNIVEKELDYHYIDVKVICKHDESQTPQNTEPHNHENWEWWSIEEIEARRKELFYPIDHFLEIK